MAFAIMNFLVLFFSFASLTLANPTDLSGLRIVSGRDITDYNGGVMRFSGTIHGVPAQFNGTAQQIYAQFKTLHPDVVAQHGPVTIGNLTESEHNLEKRGGMILPPLCCPIRGQNWVVVPRKPIFEGISYLKSLVGGCSVPRGCTRISCSYNGGIFLCNDYDHEIHPTCSYLADYAQQLINYCTTHESGTDFVCGQVFDQDPYNVVVRWDQC